MNNYFTSQIFKEDQKGQSDVLALLTKEGITIDPNIDYTIGMYNEKMELVATGSAFKNTLRCFAVDSKYQGEGLLNTIISKLIEYQYSIGNTDMFLYTKCEKVPFFEDLGFSEVARVNNKVVFLEKNKKGFKEYINSINRHLEGKIGALVMNCNPFTLGHQKLIEYAASQCDYVYLFVLSEDASTFPFAVRYKLVQEGTKHLKNVIVTTTESYLISNATFPSYFLKDDTTVVTSHATLDATIFSKIASQLNISTRFVGDEPFSEVTNIYNSVLKEQLPKHNINLQIVHRFKNNVSIISASIVRQILATSQVDDVANYVPQTTLNYLKSDEAKVIIKKLREDYNGTNK